MALCSWSLNEYQECIIHGRNVCFIIFILHLLSSVLCYFCFLLFVLLDTFAYWGFGVKVIREFDLGGIAKEGHDSTKVDRIEIESLSYYW